MSVLERATALALYRLSKNRKLLETLTEQKRPMSAQEIADEVNSQFRGQQPKITRVVIVQLYTPIGNSSHYNFLYSL